jgi:hypothetical protein
MKTLIDSEIVLGDTAIEVSVKLARLFEEVDTFYLTSYKPSLGLDERYSSSVSDKNESILKNASIFRGHVGKMLPYWESVFIASWTDPNFSFFTKEALKHTDSRGHERRIEMKRQEMTKSGIISLKNRFDETTALAFCSVCKLKNGNTAYIPLMDFRVEPSSENLSKIEFVCESIGIPGAILKSGKSYHFFGFKLLSKDEMLSFLGKCILLSPITDVRYIGHRLIEGSCDLRISTSKTKLFMPVVERLCGQNF